MLAEEMLVAQTIREWRCRGVEQDRVVREMRDFLEHGHRLERLGNRWSPAKGRVSGQQCRRYMAMVELHETPHDRVSRIRLVLAFDLIVRQVGDHRDRAMKVVRVRRAETGDLAARLRPDRGVVRVRMDDTADRVERAIQREVCRQIRRRPALPSTTLPSRSTATRSRSVIVS